jgi:C1A family cysteine protease
LENLIEANVQISKIPSTKNYQQTNKNKTILVQQASYLKEGQIIKAFQNYAKNITST